MAKLKRVNDVKKYFTENKKLYYLQYYQVQLFSTEL